MKKLVSILILLASLIAVSSCIDTEDDPAFDETLLYGKWQSRTLFYNYKSDHTGTTWDTADDVTEVEAKKFTWRLVKDELTHIYVTEITASTKASIPKVYTVVTLTADKLVYEDDYGKVFSFAKVK